MVNTTTDTVHLAEECDVSLFWKGKAILGSNSSMVAFRPLCHCRLNEGYCVAEIPLNVEKCYDCLARTR